MISKLATDVWNMPAYYLPMWFWARLVGFNAVGLAIPSIVACVIGIIFIAKCGHKIGGWPLAIASAVACLCTITIPYHTTLIRPYGFLFMLSALTMYFWLNKKQKPFFIFATLLILTHWVGCFLVAFYALTEIKQWKKLFWYTIPFTLLIVWIAYCFSMGQLKMLDSVDWTSRPTWKNFLFPCGELFDYRRYHFSGYIGSQQIGFYHYHWQNLIFVAFFLVGCCSARGKVLLIVASCFFVYTGLVVFSLIMPWSLFASRYFFVILPQVYLLIAFGFWKLCCYARLLWCKIRT